MEASSRGKGLTRGGEGEREREGSGERKTRFVSAVGKRDERVAQKS